MTLNFTWQDLEIPSQNKKVSFLEKELITSLENSLGFSKVMPIQKAVIPLFCSNKDVAVEAATGSGKTLAFLLPILQMLYQQKAKKNPYKPTEIFAFIISPTRELARQTYDVCLNLMKGLSSQDLTVCLYIGGTKT